MARMNTLSHCFSLRTCALGVLSEDWSIALHLVLDMKKSWDILGDRLIPLAPLSLVGFYMWAPLKV